MARSCLAGPGSYGAPAFIMPLAALFPPLWRGPWLEGSEMSESYAELLERLEATKRTLRNALEFINDDRHLTDQGIAARKALLVEIEAIEEDVEAIRQEHTPGQTFATYRARGCPSGCPGLSVWRPLRWAINKT